MDEGLSKAVREVFVRLYEEGLIYRDNRLINWCPRCHTALSDLEVEHDEKQGQLWHLRYPVKGSDRILVVATTRPETMLGDTAVAVHPEDERYADLIGKTRDPAAARPGDPGHRRRLRRPRVRHRGGEDHPGPRLQRLRGRQAPRPRVHQRPRQLRDSSTRTAAPTRGWSATRRARKVVADLEELGLLEKIEDHANAVGECYRCKTVIEPYISPAVVRQGPARWPRRRSRRCSRGAPASSPPSGRRPTTSGCSTSRTGASAARSGGGTASPPGTATSCGEITVTREDAEACAHCGSERHPPGDRRPRHLVLQRPVALLDHGLARADRDPGQVLPDLLPGHRLRHPLLLGRPDDDDGAQVHGRGPLHGRLHPRPGARRPGAEDEQEQGERHRSPLGHRRVRRRRLPFHPHRLRRHGARHQALPPSASPATRRLPTSCGTPPASP